LFINGLTL